MPIDIDATPVDELCFTYPNGLRAVSVSWSRKCGDKGVRLPDAERPRGNDVSSPTGECHRAASWADSWVAPEQGNIFLRRGSSRPLATLETSTGSSAQNSEKLF